MVGGEWFKDYAAVQRRTPAGAGGASWAAYLKAKNATSEGYETAFKELDIAARQEGVIANRPAVASNMSQAQYQEVLSQYLANINNEVLKKNVTNALKDVQRQGMAAGVNVGLPTLANLTNANADSLVNNYINTVNQRIYINYANTAIKDLQTQGVANGVNVPIPAIASNISQAQAQEIVNRYQSQVNNALLVKSTQDALQNVRSQAVSYGVNVAVPTISSGITEQAANALIDKYVADVNSRLSKAAVAANSTASPTVSKSTTPSSVTNGVTITKDASGILVSESLYKQLKEAQTKYKSWYSDYSGIPEQVINSQATDVRINSDGQFEWTPVTAGDKAQLEKINRYRKSSGLTPRTTLVHGPEKSDAYNTKWLSNTGSGSRGVGESGVKIKDASGKTIKSYDYSVANLAKVGSGDIKIASVKAGSGVNANATAKTNTAQSVKAVKLTQKEIAANHPGQIQLRDGTWINQVQGSQGIKESVKIISAVKSLEEADKLYQQKVAGNYNPTVGTVTNEYMKAKHGKYIADVKAAKALAAEIEKNFKPILDAREKVVNPITVQGKFGTGAASVKFKSGDYEKTAKAYQSELKAAQQNAKIPITNKTSAKDKKIILEAREYIKNHNINADLSSAAFAGSKAVPFKTVDQLNYEKALKSDLPLFALSAKLNKQLTEALSYKNVTSKVSKKAEEANKAVSEYLDLPSLAEIEKKRDALIPDIQFKVTQPGKATREYSLKSKHRDVQKVIYGNKYREALFDTTYNTLESARKKPVTSAATVAAIYASGAIAGVAIEGGLGAIAAGAGRVALGAGKTAKAAGYVSKYTPTVGHTALGATVAYEGGKTVLSGDAQKTVNFVASLAVGGLGYSKGAKIAKDPISIIPGAKRLSWQVIPEGAAATVKDVKLGTALTAFDKPIIARTNGKWSVGTPDIDPSFVAGKRIHPYTKTDTIVFDKYVSKNFDKVDQTYYFGGKDIATVGYNLKNPIVRPKNLEILSKHISDDMKPTVREAIIAYAKGRNNYIQVYGSNAFKMQSGKYLHGKPKDLETHVDSVAKFLPVFRKVATKAGFLEGKDYKFTVNGKTVTSVTDSQAPKIEFNINGKWEKGIEAFSQKEPVAGKPGVEYGDRIEKDLPFGFKAKKSIKVDGVNVMQAQEQMVRTYRGGTMLVNNKLTTDNPGRVKDLRRLVEVGTGNEIEFKTKISKTIIEYAKATSEKFEGMSESPITAYIAKNEKLPNRAQAFVLNSEALLHGEKNRIVKAIDRKNTGKLVRLSGKKRNEKLITKTQAAKFNSFLKSESAELIPTKNIKPKNKPKVVKSKLTPTQKAQQTAHTTRKKTVQSKFLEGRESRVNKPKQKVEPKDLLFDSKKASVKKLAEIKGIVEFGSKAIPKVKAKGISQSSKAISGKSNKVGKATTSKATTSKTMSSKSVPSKLAFSKATTSKSMPSKAVSSKSTPSKAIPSKAIPSKSIPSKSVPSKATSSRAIPSKSIETKKPSKKIPVSKSAGSQSMTSRYKGNKKTPAQVRGKKAANKLTRHGNDRKHLQRKIRNTLGSMKSMFG